MQESKKLSLTYVSPELLLVALLSMGDIGGKNLIEGYAHVVVALLQ
jgi:hypothetical protein